MLENTEAKMANLERPTRPPGQPHPDTHGLGDIPRLHLRRATRGAGGKGSLSTCRTRPIRTAPRGCRAAAKGGGRSRGRWEVYRPGQVEGGGAARNQGGGPSQPWASEGGREMGTTRAGLGGRGAGGEEGAQMWECEWHPKHTGADVSTFPAVPDSA